MTNEYHRDIVAILLSCGQAGLPVRDIARRIYNFHYGLFESSLDFHRLHQQIRFYLWHQSRRHYSLLKEQHGARIPSNPTQPFNWISSTS